METSIYLQSKRYLAEIQFLCRKMTACSEKMWFFKGLLLLPRFLSYFCLSSKVRGYYLIFALGGNRGSDALLLVSEGFSNFILVFRLLKERLIFGLKTHLSIVPEYFKQEKNS